MKKLIITILTVSILFLQGQEYLSAEGPDITKKEASSEGKPSDTIAIGISSISRDAELDIYNTIYKVPLKGVKLEFFRGYRFPLFSGFWYGAALTYIQLGSDHDFQADIDPDPAVDTQAPFTITAKIASASLTGRIAYLSTFWRIQLGVDFGIGASSYYSQVNWNVLNPPQLDNDIERESGSRPIFDWALKIGFKTGDHNTIGITAGVTVIPVNIKIEGQTDWGPLNVNSLAVFGVYWQTFF